MEIFCNKKLTVLGKDPVFTGVMVSSLLVKAIFQQADCIARSCFLCFTSSAFAIGLPWSHEHLWQQWATQGLTGLSGIYKYIYV